jgi:hypothetical protein
MLPASETINHGCRCIVLTATAAAFLPLTKQTSSSEKKTKKINHKQYCGKFEIRNLCCQ